MYIMLFALLAVVSTYDCITHRIPNYLSLGGLVCGLFISAVSLNPIQNGISIQESVYGVLAAGGLPLLLYVNGSGGAGDVKIAWAIGAFLGWREGMTAVLIGYLLAGAFGLGWLIITGRAWRICAVSLRYVGHRLITSRIAKPSNDSLVQVDKTMAMSPFFLIGVLAVYLDGAYR